MSPIAPSGYLWPLPLPVLHSIVVFLHRQPGYPSIKGCSGCGRYYPKNKGFSMAASNHKALRLWAKDNPGRVHRDYAAFGTDTEVLLESADRVESSTTAPLRP